MKRAVPLLLLVLATGCPSTLKNSRVRPDYAATDRASLKRLVVVTAPAAPEGAPEQLGELWSRIARRYVNLKRNFIVKAHTSLPKRPDAAALQALCTEAAEGLEGVLLLEPTSVRRVGDGEGVEAAVHAQLTRCTDGQEVWSAEAAGSFSSVDKGVTDSAALWTEGLDPAVVPYAAPAFNLLRPTLESLPEPAPLATEEELVEKGEAELF
jgi:probable lipoprotein (TIGR04455 family)